jgi:predicted lipoprotein
MRLLRTVSLFLVAAALGGPFGCRKVATGAAPVQPDLTLPDGTKLRRSDVLGAFGRCAAGLARDFVSKAEALEAAEAAWMAEPQSPEKRAAARAAWNDAMVVWERAEVFVVGPAAALAQPGGQDLRSQIYPWPLSSRCLVEQGIVSRAWEQPTFASGLVTTRTLVAGEYLTFYEGADNACGPNATINAQGTWAALGPAELASRRAAYAHAVAVDVLARARALDAAWDPARGNFVAELETAGQGSKTYKSQQLAFNAMSDALFQIELQVKELKVGKPSGIVQCMNATCPEALESPWAHRSKEHVRNNLVGVRMQLQGCDDGGKGIGWDDMLRGLGQIELADRMDAALAGCFAALDAIPEADFSEALATNLPGMQKLFGAIKALTEILKSDFVTVLDLELPKVVEGDND